MDDLVHSHWIGALRSTPVELRLPDRFVLVGVEWLAPVDARIELRARTAGGGWSPWTLASVQGHDADGAGAPAHACFGEPVWTGNASDLQLRASRPVEGISVHVVSASVRRQVPARAAFARRSDATDASDASVDGYPLATPVLPAGPEGQPPIIARRAWAGSRGAAAAPEYGDVRMMFVHHSVNPNGYSAGEVAPMLLSIYEYHRYVRGYDDIGYNFAIDAYGRTWEAREGGIDQAVVGAQAGGYNLESSGVVMLGTFTAVLPTSAALAALNKLLAWKLCLHGVPVSGPVTVEVDPPDAYYTAFRPGQRVTLTRIAGHRQGCTTDCPGDDLFGHMPAVRAGVLDLVGPKQLTLTLDFVPSQHARPATYLDLATATVPAGAPVVVVGRLSSQTSSGVAGAPVAGSSLEIQSLVGSSEAVLSSPEGPLSAVTTDAEGRFSAEFAPQHNLLVRALATTAPAVASPLLAIGVKPTVTLTIATQYPLVLTGTVSPPKPRVELDVYAATGKHALKHKEIIEVAADGSFSVRPKLPAGAYSLQAVSAADALNLAAQSAPVAVTIS